MTLETANRLFELRKKHNLSQEELAEKLGVSRQAVSKWERSEASPDTDNLIALAKIYNLSLDELIYGEKEDKKEDSQKQESEEESKEDNADNNDATLFIDVEDGDNKVKIGPSGIVVESDDGEKVKISLSGIKIETSKSDGDDDDENNGDTVLMGGDGKVKIKVNKPDANSTRFWLEVPYPMICVIAYLLCGFYNVLGGWELSWVVFATIPIYYSFVESIYKKRFSEFAYPVFAAFIYLVCGMYYGNWSPSWIIFVTIPVYYPIANAIDSKIKDYQENKNK